jgi:hypothetical protein
MDLTRLYGDSDAVTEIPLSEQISEFTLEKLAKSAKISKAEAIAEIDSGKYDLNKVGMPEAKNLSTSDHVNSYVKTAVDLGLGYGIGKAMSLDTKDSEGAVFLTALSAQILGSLIEKHITKPYITKPEHKLVDTAYNPVDFALILANAYHGYIRNNESLAYGSIWGLSSLFVGAELTGAAISQGFGKKVGK